jgi:hypothetical protein
MVAYLDDWLLFSKQPMLVATIIQHIRALSLTINREKSILDPTRTLVYLGLSINTTQLTITPTTNCLQHLMQLTTIVQQATQPRSSTHNRLYLMVMLRHELAIVLG